MKLKIHREYKIEKYALDTTYATLLDILIEIRENIDPTLSFDYGCKSGVCGACALRVNGEELLACQYDARSGDFVEPLRNYDVVRDLMVDKSLSLFLIKKAKASMHHYTANVITTEDEHDTIEQSNCILCSSCYSACPALDENEDFLGPFALTRVLRYANDKREEASTIMIETIQDDGIWDCVLCSACTDVCPQYIDPKEDITHLIKMSLASGYQDPNN